jgi:DNA-binding response OmpR family regulator
MSTNRVVENSPEKILVLESGESSRRNLEELLEGAGYEVTTECLCEQGLKAAREQGVHLLLLDSALAGLDCANVLAELKGAAVTSGIRVILLEAGGASERARGLDLGADDVV